MNCKDYFLKLLSRREYSGYELLRKGREKGFELEEINLALNYLQLEGYQSDSRLITAMILSATGKYGKSVVKRKCLEKGVKADVFEQTWLSQTEDEPADELVSLKAKIMRKYHIDDFQVIDPKTKAKLWNYLKYRGFNPFEILEQWQKESD